MSDSISSNPWGARFVKRLLCLLFGHWYELPPFNGSRGKVRMVLTHCGRCGAVREAWP